MRAGFMAAIAHVAAECRVQHRTAPPPREAKSRPLRASGSASAMTRSASVLNATRCGLLLFVLCGGIVQTAPSISSSIRPRASADRVAVKISSLNTSAEMLPESATRVL